MFWSRNSSVQCLVVFGTGDTVNIASRMESNSEVLKIHCSEAAANLVMVQDPSLLLIPRGAIPVKGKSKMNTFWVHASNPSKDAGIYMYDRYLYVWGHVDMMHHSLCPSSQLSHFSLPDKSLDARARLTQSVCLSVPSLSMDLTDSKWCYWWYGSVLQNTHPCVSGCRLTCHKTAQAIKEDMVIPQKLL